MNNEPAFPVPKDRDWTGISIRDYFAAKAMQGFAAGSEASFKKGIAGMAEYAYKWAEAMIAEREKQ